MRDPYAVLGVARSAGEKEIKSAFRHLAKQYHPDTNADDPAAAARFNEANQAYEILGDKEKRAQFDKGEIDAEGKPKFAGFSGFGGGSPFGAGTRRGSSGGFDFRSSSRGEAPGGADSMFSDFFDQAFGGLGGGRTGASGFTAARNAASKGEDIRATLKVRLEDAVSRDKVEAVFPNGKRLAIRMPDGVEDGQVIRLKGQGQPALVQGAPPGDALVTIEFVEHPRFRVEKRDLVHMLDLPLADAVLGGRVFVSTLDGRVALSVPPWTSSGKTFRLKGKGLTTKSGGRGDLLVEVRITLPSAEDAELAAFLRARAERETAAG